jgi:hypothetical protein
MSMLCASAEAIIPLSELGEVLVREQRALTPEERRRLDEHLGRNPLGKHAKRSAGGKFVKGKAPDTEPSPEESRVLPGTPAHEA